MEKCVECGEWFHANDKNAVDVKIMGLYGTMHKTCAEKLIKKGKARVIKQ